MQYKFFETAEILLYYDTTQRKWYIKNNITDNDCDLSLTDNLSCFLQLFYEDPSTFFTSLSKKAKEKNIKEEILNALPFKECIIFCIKNKMFFWLELSLKWLEFINIDDELRKAMETVVTDSKSPQNVRHKLRKVIK